MDRDRIIPFVSHSAEETIAFGYALGQKMEPGSIICLSGDLGAGKTTLIKGIVSALTETRQQDVSSPTFGYFNIYEGKWPVHHFDLYRLDGLEAFLNLGLEEYLFCQAVCCVEWSERIASILPENTHHITLSHMGEEKRKIVYAVSKCPVY